MRKPEKQTLRERFCALLRDLAKALCIGAAMAAVLFALLFVLGWMLHGFALAVGLDWARRGLFVAGALALFVSAGALIADQKAAALRSDPRWRAHFALLGLFGVLAASAACVLLAACGLDLLLYYSL